MSALAEALLAAQRQAIGALSKAYVALPETDEERARQLFHDLDTIGCTDKVEQAQLLACLSALRNLGGSAPMPTHAAPESRKAPEPPSQAQLNLIAKLGKERNWTPPDVVNSKAEAHEIIEAMKDGSYDVAKYARPF